MRYQPSPSVQAELIKAGLEQFCNGIDFEDADWDAQREYFRSHPIHAQESEVEIDDRTGYFLIWRDHGVPQGSDKSAVAVDGLNAKRITVMHEALREMCREHFPKLASDFADVKKSTSVQANNARALNSQMVQFIDEIHTASVQTAAALEGVRGAVIDSSQCRLEDAVELKAAIAKGLRRLGKIALWSVAAIGLLLTALIVLSVRAHAQIDVIHVQEGGTDKAVFAAPFKLNFASGCTVTRSGSTASVTCTGAAGNPGGSATQVQYNNAGTSFSGISTMTTDGTIVTAKVGTNWLFVDPTDATKKAQWDASNIATGTTRTYNFPNANATLAQAVSAVAHKFVTQMSTQGVFTLGQAASTDLADFSTTAPSTDGQIPIYDSTAPNAAGGTGAFVPGDPKVQGLTAHDAVGTSTNPVAEGGYASAAAPSDVSNDGDIVRAWFFRNGAQATVLTAAGALIGGDAANGLDVDVTRLPSLPAGTNVIGHVIADTGSTTVVTGNVAVTKADGSDVTLGAKADAKSTATDTTAATIMQVMKEISFMEQNPASRAVTNAGTFAAQATLQTQTDTTMVGGVNVKEINAVTPLMGNGTTGTGSQRVTVASDNTPFPVKTDQTTHGTTDLVAADITKVGGAAVALGQTTATASIPVVIASDQSPLAVFARTMPLLNYSSFTLQDANTVLWVTTMSDTGALSTVTTTSGTVLPLYFNDIATRTTYQIGVSTGGVLTETSVTFNPQYPAAIGFVTSGGKKSALLMNSAVFYALQPTSVADWNVAVADGGDVTQGATTDTRVAGDAPGSLSAKLRAISYSVDQIVRQKSVNARVTGSFNRPVTSTGDALDVNVKYPPASADPCSGRKRNVAISQTGNAQLVGAGPGTIWICSIFVMGADAENVSLVEGSGATCATGTAAVIGGTTAAAGPNMAANGGFAPGNGSATIAATVTPGNSLCLFQSGSGRVAGNLTFAYAQ